MKCNSVSSIVNSKLVLSKLNIAPVKPEKFVKMTGLLALATVPLALLKNKEKSVANDENYNKFLDAINVKIGSETSRFKSVEKQKLLAMYADNPKLVTRLVEQEDIFEDVNGNRFRFNFDEIFEIFDSGKSNPEVVYKLINEVDTEELSPRFTGYEIASLTSVAKRVNPNVFENIINERGISNWTLFNLLKMSEFRPEEYYKMKNAGVFELVKAEKLDEGVLSNINKNFYLSKEVLENIRKYADGKSLVTTLPSGISLDEARQICPVGDVYELDKKLYINYSDLKRVAPLNISKEKFEELFPISDSLFFKQGKLGDCWFLASVDELMSKSTGKAYIYSLFEQDGNDILVKFKKSKQKVRFKNGELIDLGGKGVVGCKGIQMLEQAYMIYLKHICSKPGKKDIIAQEVKDIDKCEKKIDGGYSEYAMDDLLGYSYTFKEFIKSLFVSKKEEIRKMVREQANDDNIVTFCSFDKGDAKAESAILSAYDILAKHAYSVKGYKPETDSLLITNPHNTSLVIEVPFSLVEDYFSNYGMIKFRY